MATNITTGTGPYVNTTAHGYNAGTNASTGANAVTLFYERAGIKAANAVNIYQQFADNKSMPPNYGKTFKISKFLKMYDRSQFDANGAITSDFNKYGYLTARSVDDVNAALSAASLSEGVGTQNQRFLKKITMETSLARYGEMLEYTDEVDLFSEDLIQTRYREELGNLANQRYEDLIQMDMLATPTRMYSGVATSIATVGTGAVADGSNDSVHKVSYDLIRAASRKLTRNRAKRNTTVITGSTKIATTPVAKAYYAVIGADVKADLESLMRGEGKFGAEFVFVPVHKYADAGSLAEGEVGSMHETRFIESESAVVYRGAGASVPANYVGNLQNTSGKFDVFPILFPTQGAFATVGLKGKGKIDFRAMSPNETSLINPYGTKGFFSYNFFYASIILEPEKLLAVYVAAGK